MFLAEGYLGLNMDRLAEAVEYSKPTIYGHFSTKEDLLLAVSNTALRQRCDLFVRAAGYKGRSRERMAAVGMADMIFVHVYREHYNVERILKTASIWEKASELRRAEHQRLDQFCMGAIAGIIGGAIAEKDLDPEFADPAAIGEGLRAISIGMHMVVSFRQRSEAEVAQMYDRLRHNQMRLLDGWGWRPFTHEWNYDEAFQRIAHEVFPEEVEQLPAALRDTSSFAL